MSFLRLRVFGLCLPLQGELLPTALAADDAHDIAVLQRGSEGRRFVGVFSLRAASAPVAVELPDGSYENLIDGAKITVQNGTLFCTGAPVILCTEEAES